MNNHKKYIERTFELALKGVGKVSPNPLVGSVIVKNDKIISEGWHKEFGLPHAEADAINYTDADLTGASIYVNLEPCCHTNKKTPPCVPAIISAGISEVIISNVDPNPDMSGNGIRQLQGAGIKVTSGVLEEEGKELNKFFFKSVVKKMPYVCVKVAQTLDGKIAYKENERIQITGKESQAFVHKLRSEYDAVMIGSNTVVVDNPKLTVRDVEGRNPKRIVLSKDLTLSLDKNLFIDDNKNETIVVTTSLAPRDNIDELERRGCKVILSELDDKNNIDIKLALEKLYKENIASVLVEGGSKIFSEFVDNNMADEIIVFQSPKIFGSGLDAFSLKSIKNYKYKDSRKIGDDIMLVLKSEKL